MSFDIEPKNPEAGVYGMPNGFWNAFCIETPVSEVLGCKYIDDGKKIHYEHDGFMGSWISKDMAIQMWVLLKAFVKTKEYENHRYFSERKSQMENMLTFLPICDGFRKCD